VRALLRRHTASDDEVQAVRFAGWQFSFAARSLLDPSGQALALTLGEASLLHAFTSQPGRILSRDRLMDVAWDRTAENFDRAVDLQVSRLRRKLAERDSEPLIETLRGQGYRFLPVVARVR
jgi:two-component system OmpR family response regulator